jgi:hypothetical protein
MHYLAWELILALLTIGAITIGYLNLAQAGIPQPGSLVGHALGFVGFLMMLSTEILYSLRKRLPRFTRGRMSTWLQWHIFTGLVGPYLVLLHSAWKFNGLAGILTLATLVVVVSGLVGRYIYTAIPRSLDGVELSASELEQQIVHTQQRLRVLGLEHLTTTAGVGRGSSGGWQWVLGRAFLRWRQRRKLDHIVKSLGVKEKAQVTRLHKLLSEHQSLQTQLNSLEGARRLLAVWHLFHIPLSAGLFVLAFVHIGAALHYGTLSK